MSVRDHAHDTLSVMENGSSEANIMRNDFIIHYIYVPIFS